MGFRATVALCFALVSLQALPSSRGNGVSEICRDVAFGTIDSDIPLTVNIVAEFADWEVAWARMHKQLDYSWNNIERMRMGVMKSFCQASWVKNCTGHLNMEEPPFVHIVLHTDLDRACVMQRLVTWNPKLLSILNSLIMVHVREVQLPRLKKFSVILNEDSTTVTSTGFVTRIEGEILHPKPIPKQWEMSKVVLVCVTAGLAMMVVGMALLLAFVQHNAIKKRIVEDRVKERFMRVKPFNRPQTNGEARTTITPRPVVTRQASRSMTTSGDLTEEVNQQEPLPVVIVKKLTADEDGTPYEHSHGAPVYITQTSFESSTNSLDLGPYTAEQIELRAVRSNEDAASSAEQSGSVVSGVTGSSASRYTGTTMSSRPSILSQDSQVTRSSGMTSQKDRTMKSLKVEYDKLSLNKLIGSSRCKEVFRGKWSGSTVAILKLRSGGIVTEGDIMHKLGGHPNLVQFYRWSRDPAGSEYLVMELLPMGTLNDLLRKTTLPLREKLQACEQVCSAMVELNEESVVHCDLATRNVMIVATSPLHVKVADFGLSHAWSDMENSSSLKKLLDCIPLRWAAPEIFSQGDGSWKWSEKTDVWAFGVVLWEIFSDGDEPYTRELGPDAGNMDILDYILAKKYLSKPENCPTRIYELMEQCWRFEPENRPSFKCLQTCLQELELVCNNNPGGLSKSYSSRPTRSNSKGKGTGPRGLLPYSYSAPMPHGSLPQGFIPHAHGAIPFPVSAVPQSRLGAAQTASRREQGGAMRNTAKEGEASSSTILQPSSLTIEIVPEEDVAEEQVAAKSPRVTWAKSLRSPGETSAAALPGRNDRKAPSVQEEDVGSSAYASISSLTSTGETSAGALPGRNDRKAPSVQEEGVGSSAYASISSLTSTCETSAAALPGRDDRKAPSVQEEDVGSSAYASIGSLMGRTCPEPKGDFQQGRGFQQDEDCQEDGGYVNMQTLLSGNSYQERNS